MKPLGSLLLTLLMAGLLMVYVYLRRFFDD